MNCEIVEIFKQNGFSVSPIKEAIDNGTYTKKVRRSLESYLMDEVRYRQFLPTGLLVIAKFYRFYTNKVEGVLKDRLLYGIENGSANMEEIAHAKAWGYYTDLHEMKYQKHMEMLIRAKENWRSQNYKAGKINA